VYIESRLSGSIRREACQVDQIKTSPLRFRVTIIGKAALDLPTYEIQDRWYGIYSQCKTQDIFLKDIDARIHVATGIGGKGMTGSAGFAKHHLEIILN